MGSTTDEKRQQVSSAPFVADEAVGELGELVNSSGHVQELDRNFGFWSICSIGIVADDGWAAGAGSLVRSPRHAAPWGTFWTMLILASLRRWLLFMMEELLASSTNCEFNPRDLSSMLTKLDQWQYCGVHLLLLHRRRPCRACFSDSLVCFGYECDRLTTA